METTGKDRPGPMQEFLTLQKMASLRICTGRGIRDQPTVLQRVQRVVI